LSGKRVNRDPVRRSYLTETNRERCRIIAAFMYPITETGRSRLSRSIANPESAFRTIILTCLVATLGYLAAALGGVLILRPQMVWPLWPGNAILASLLLLASRKRWPIFLAAGLGGFVFYDVQVGVSIRSTALLILADTIEILVAAVGIGYAFDGVPRLNSLKALTKYSVFALILAPLSVTFVGAMALSPNYWTSWRISFFSEALAFLTVTPAILGFVSQGRPSLRAARSYYLEAATLIAALISLSYFIFVAPGRSSSPALFYSLVPLLLWSALRFGSTGVSTSMILIAFLSIWGASRGRGPFLESEPLNKVLSLQLFLLFAAAPFMVFAALVEERKQGEEELRESEERLRLAVQAGMMYAFEWDMASDVIVRSGQCRDILNWMEDPARDAGRQFITRVHPDDRGAYALTETGLTPENPTYQISYRMPRPDGSVIWLEESGRGFFDGKGGMLRTIGMVVDVTERKLAEEAVSSVSRRLIEAQEQERARIARELHDDLSQRMALLQIGLEQFEQDTPGLPFKARQQLHNIAEAATEVSSDIHNLSQRLHPSKLDTLGLVTSLERLCREFSRQHQLQVEFVHRDILGQIPHDVTLCLFRIVQEALRNVVKHSGSADAKVELLGHDDRIDLCISDSGTGFNPAAVKADTGLGLISMRERLALVRGHLAVESEPSHGTRVQVRVPVFKTTTGATNEERAHKAGA
jgi:PAS domain S-box-containing protein